MFDIKKLFTTPKLKKKVNLINDNLGGFHQNEYWSLEILVNQNPEHDVIKKIINALAQELKIEKYLTQNIINTREKKKHFIHIDKLKKINWLKENRKSFPIIEVDKFYIYGSHIKKKNLNNILPIKINASTAFGTGSHATTKYCLKSINFLSKIFNPKKVLDYGCGTGILGIAAKKVFKRSEITLVDIDQEAIKLSKHNIKLNNMHSRPKDRPIVMFYKLSVVILDCSEYKLQVITVLSPTLPNNAKLSSARRYNFVYVQKRSNQARF